MSLYPALEYLPYDTSKACQNALFGIEAIDYFFARQIVSCHQSSLLAGSTTQESELIFHILIALSYFQRQGSVCISLSNLAGQTLWLDPSNQILLNEERNNDSPNSSGTSSQIMGYSFCDRTSIMSIFTKFLQGLPSQIYLVLQDDRLYSKRYWQYEQNLCRFIAGYLTEANLELWQASIDVNQSEIRHKMQVMFPAKALENNQPDLQQLSVLNALYSPFSIITGGAGTGKTYTITRLAVLLCAIRGISANSIEMAAPTGKAANRLSQSLNNELSKLKVVPELSSICADLSKVEPKTISRLLKINPNNGKSAYDPQRPLSAKLVIIDETSMIDISLMNKLINSLSGGTQLILVGDPNQLPSVETGCLLADLVAHPIGNLTCQRWDKLRHVYSTFESANNYVRNVLTDSNKYAKSAVNRLSRMRRSNSEIVSFAQAVLASNSKEALFLAGNADTNSAIQIKSLINKDVSNIVNTHADIQTVLSRDIITNFFALFKAQTVEEAFAAIKRYALLTPFRKSMYGTSALNQYIEQLLSRHFNWIIPNSLYRCKPIMILQNDYQLSLFNGDLGVIWEDENKQKIAYFTTSKGLVKYSIYNLPAFDVNYAMTIHKTQGSEFEAVDIILPNLNSDFLNKQLLYTGITRAQKKVRLFTQASTLTQMIERSADRISGIDKNLTEAIDLLN